MTSSKIDQILKLAEAFEELAGKGSPSQVFYRANPIGKSLFGHTSGLASEKVSGIFAFEDPNMLFDTYSWIHMKKNPENYELVTFKGKLVDRPADSEGVVVEPEEVLSKMPLSDFAKQHFSN